MILAAARPVASVSAAPSGNPTGLTAAQVMMKILMNVETLHHGTAQDRAAGRPLGARGPARPRALPRGTHPGCRLRGPGQRIERPGGPERGPPPAARPRGSSRRPPARWGINTGDTVVAYDDGGNTSAARLWWLLRYAGFGRSTCSTAAWPPGARARLSGRTAARSRPSPGDVQLPVGAHARDRTSTGGRLGRITAYCWMRAPGERYRGEIEPVDPRAGHIPGAVSAPTSRQPGVGRQFLPAEELRERFAALGATRHGRPPCTAAPASPRRTRSRHWKSPASPRRFSRVLVRQWSNDSGLPVATGRLSPRRGPRPSDDWTAAPGQG